MKNFDQFEKDLDDGFNCTLHDNLCLQCTHQKCLECNEGYQIFQGKCIVDKPVNCQEVEVKDNKQIFCKYCKNGFAMFDDRIKSCQKWVDDKNYYISNQRSHYCKLGSGSVLMKVEKMYQLNCQNCTTQKCLKCHDDLKQCVLCSPGYALDENQIVEKKCVKCLQEMCLQCDGTKMYDCKECISGFKLTTIGDSHTGSCVECTESTCSPENVCKSDQFRMKTYPYLCRQCMQYCLKCNSLNTCEKCVKGSTLDKNGICLKNHEAMYYDNTTQSLKRCNYTCSKCSDSSNLCDQCSQYFPLFIEILNGKHNCYSICPLGYSKFNDSCVFDKQQKQINQQDAEIAQRNLFILQNSQKQCPQHCRSCIDNNNCLICFTGFYWDNNKMQCLPCNIYCDECTGPLLQDCTNCLQSLENLLGMAQNVICSNLTKNMTFSLNYCNKQYYQISNGFNHQFTLQYSSDMISWDYKLQKINEGEVLSVGLQPYFKNIIANICVEIMETLSIKSRQYATLFSISLSQFLIRRGAFGVNPKDLYDDLKNKSKISKACVASTSRKYKNCRAFKCLLQIQRNKIEWSDSTSIQIIKQITFQNECKSETLMQQNEINPNKMEAFDNLVNFYNSSDFALILNVCAYEDNNNIKRIPVLLSKQLGDGFYEYIHPSEFVRTNNLPFTLYINGATFEQNISLNKCYPRYSSPFSAYKMLSAEIYQISERKQNGLTDQIKQLFVFKKQKAEANNSNNCRCMQVRDFIKLFDGKGGFLSQSISPNIRVARMLKIFKLQSFPPPTFALSYAQKQLIFDIYVNELITRVHVCYKKYNFIQLSQCVQNILIDYAYVNDVCLMDETLMLKIHNPDYSEQAKQLSNYLLNQKFCIQDKRCKKYINILKMCV